jgi:hypothetical protein
MAFLFNRTLLFNIGIITLRIASYVEKPTLRKVIIKLIAYTRPL